MQALDISNLCKTYSNDVRALKGISLEVKQGDFFALLGPNGAGKSTAIGIITSLVTKSGGDVKIFGHDLDNETELAKAQIGLVPQEFNFNIFETVMNIVLNQAGYYGLPRKLAHERAEFYLKKLELWDKRHAVSRTLSGGMKRRLMIARALTHQPKLLILDEPTAGVDIEVRRSMWDFLREINEEGTPIILTTHYLEEAEYLCKNVAIIHQGEIIENTSIKALIHKLQIETFVLNLEAALRELPDFSPFETRLIDETTIEVDIDKDQSLNDLFAHLSQHKLKVVSLRNKTNRLEELFLHLTHKTEAL